MPSPIEKIFKEIFGYLPDKQGTAFEQLAAIASYLLKVGNVQHDARLRGQFSDTLYQIDVHHISATDKTASMGEAKDYSEQGQKVGRGDLQKLGGALPDLDSINSGKFFSATGYTKPAKKYAEAAKNITGGKSIDLYELRPSTELDENGFIKTVIVNIHVTSPKPHQGKWVPHFTERGNMALRTLLREGEEGHRYDVWLDSFFDEHGNEVLSLHDLTSQGYGDINPETNKAHGAFLLSNLFIKVEGIFAEIKGLEYEIPFEYYTREIRITDDSEYRFVITDENGKVLKFLTDKILKTFSFDENGNLRKR
ncbi:MAG: restriction endonuclease [Desulfomonilia bacterium]